MPGLVSLAAKGDCRPASTQVDFLRRFDCSRPQGDGSLLIRKTGAPMLRRVLGTLISEMRLREYEPRAILMPPCCACAVAEKERFSTLVATRFVERHRVCTHGRQVAFSVDPSASKALGREGRRGQRESSRDSLMISWPTSDRLQRAIFASRSRKRCHT